MKKYTFRIFAVLSVLLFAFSAHAQQIVLASGIKDGTYFRMVKQMAETCGTGGIVANKEQPGGSPSTITDILNNNVAGGVVQFDVLWMRSNNQDLTSIKTLFPLHREQVHIVVQNKDLKSGGFMGIGGDKIVLNDDRNLKGLTVAAQGGSAYTAQAINQLTGTGFNIRTEFADSNAALDAVRKGDVAAAILVGGAPMKAIQSLGRDLRLLPISPASAEKLKGVYSQRTVVYENLGTAGVPTVEVDSLLVVNNYRSAKMKSSLTAFRECIKTAVEDIAETPNTHPAWRDAAKQFNVKPRWDLYDPK